ncbi:MAG: serine/threonine protein kinase [Deltaproteobacteria bacterium]|nr:serine/threonine protein kinase [Deltaproteobacteria bacterium]
MQLAFGKYDLHARIARGGTAEVFLADQNGPDGFSKPVALKVLLPEFGHDAEFVDMLIDEARLAVRLSHPSIVQILELGKTDGRYFIAMEYVRGSNLAVLRRALAAEETKMPARATVAILSTVLEALHAAHEQQDKDGKPLNIVHRDVRPHNILISDHGIVKVADFGIAKAAINHARTRTGVIKGCFAYLSPEQARARPVDRRSDVFSAGLVLYELLSGARAYECDDELEMLGRAQHAELTPLGVACPEVPARLREVVDRALAPEPDARFQSCAAMGDALAQAAKKAGMTPFTPAQLAAFVAPFLAGVKLEPVERSLFGEELLAEAGGGVATRVVGTPKPAVPLLVTTPAGTSLGTQASMAWIAGALAVVAVLAFALWPRPNEPVPEPEPASQAATAAPIDPPPPAKAAHGYLTINSRPWSTVFVDGALVSKTTPVRRLELSIGKHRVVLQRGDGAKAELDVEITPGATVTKLYDWDAR